ncbi:MAG: hypothetical protein KatS3mg031_1268 [Chitinophagales bacterium]|nr:MAG: hypothetical protein KatS3mg031_1268 [Chitinophagales bacterium]
MSLKSWLLQREKSSFFASFLLLMVHLFKHTPHKAKLLVHGAGYLMGYYWWTESLIAVGRLNRIREKLWMIKLRKRIARIFLKKYLHEVALPANLQLKHRHLFLNNNFYLLKPLHVMPLKNHYVYLTAYLGIVFGNLKIVKESVHGRWDRRNTRILHGYYREVMDAFLRARHQSGRLIELNDHRQYLLAHHWFNYYHWLTETVLRLWIVRNRLNEYTILLPESFKHVSFVQHTLQALEVKQVLYLPEGAIVYVKNLTLVENKPYCGHYFPEYTQEIRALFSDYASRQSVHTINPADSIYFSRKKAGRRKLVNEEEAERLLTDHGFRIICPEDLSFIEQIELMKKAKFLVGIHGAALTNMLFMPPGGKVLEMHRSILSKEDLHSDVYWKLAVASGHQYYYQFCDPMHPQEDFFTADLIADIPLLRRNLEKLHL